MSDGVDVLRQGAARGLRVVCLPFAGGSARSFEPLAREAPASWWIGVPRRPPPSVPTLDDLAGATATAVRALSGQRTLLLGHSLGAVVAHRAAQLLDDHWPAGGVLVLSAPLQLDTAARDAGQLEAMAPERLVREVRRLGLLSETRHSDDVLRRLVLPGFRRDLAALRGYRHSPAPLPTRPHILGGRRDLQASVAGLSALARQLGAAAVHELDGDHLFVVSHPRAVVEVLAELAAPVAEPSRLRPTTPA